MIQKKSARGSYHHGDLRNALIDAAVAAAREEGPGAVVLRDIARRVGVSHNAGYRHFESREDLLGAVAERGLAELAAQMKAGLERAPKLRDPRERARRRLRAIGRAYVEFALAEPGLFRTIWAAASYPAPSDHAAGGPARNDAAAGAGGATAGEAAGAGGATAGEAAGAAGAGVEVADPYLLLNAALDEMVDVGAIPPARRPYSETVAWSAVHGLATLLIDGPLAAMPPADMEQALTRLCDMVDAGL